MTKYLSGIVLLMAPMVAPLANCDLTTFRWLCDIPMQTKVTHVAPSVVDCAGTLVAVTRPQYETIMRYQRANVDMTLTVNGEYVTGPCVPIDF